MAYDIISSDPWQDPKNPWPIYNSVFLKYSYDTGATDTILLSAWNFQILSDYAIIEYGTQIEDDWYNLAFVSNFYNTENEVSNWVVQYEPDSGGVVLYSKEITNRTLPTKTLNNNTGWIATTSATLSGLSSLTITPNLSDRALWQTRRLRHLGYV